MTNPELDNLLEFIRISRGFDFSGYKRSTLERRLLKRLQQVGIKSYPEYIEYLEVHPEEFTQLFNSILINVTSFFRDTATWEFLEHNSSAADRKQASAGANPRLVGRLRFW